MFCFMKSRRDATHKNVKPRGKLAGLDLDGKIIVKFPAHKKGAWPLWEDIPRTKVTCLANSISHMNVPQWLWTKDEARVWFYGVLYYRLNVSRPGRFNLNSIFG